MLKFILRILRFAGEDSRKIKLSLVVSFFKGIAANGAIMAALYVLTKIVDEKLTTGDAFTAFGIIVAALALHWILRRIFNQLESNAGVNICARERLRIGDLFKRFPMSYFTEGNLGNVTNTITGDLSFIEDHGMQNLDVIINGFISLILAFGMMLWIDWRVALIAVVTCAAALLFFDRLEKIIKPKAKIRQEQSSRLTSAALEYTQGISVIKAMHMEGEKSKKLHDTIDQTRDRAIEFEVSAAPPITHYFNVFAVAISAVVSLSAWLYFYGEISFPFMIMTFLFVFQIYRPAMAVASGSAIMRVMEASLERYEALTKVPILDANGKDIKLTRFDIEFDHVDFSYEKKQTLKNITFSVPAQSMTALVGASGSGKTTIANLIIRFWDTQKGSVRIGGVDVREMTCDSLLRYVSMVFQRVYLFKDTIEENIRFGRPGASHEEIVEAAKKARCHEFIMALPDGYNTVVGTGGSTLSGGERQRISIARAILKDAPIVLLDEATASVDPDNEKYIQEAISELVSGKTLIIIAHRLSTIRSANQILVLDNGSIVQRGRHDELLAQEGQYKNLWQRRQQARSWKVGSNV